MLLTKTPEDCKIQCVENKNMLSYDRNYYAKGESKKRRGRDAYEKLEKKNLLSYMKNIVKIMPSAV